MKNMYSLEEAFNELSRLDKRKYIRELSKYSLGNNREELKELTIQCLLKYDTTISTQNFLYMKEYDYVLDWMLNTNGQGLFLTGDIGRGKTDIILGVIRPIFLMRKGILIEGCNAHLLESEFNKLKDRIIVFIDDLGREPVGNNYGQKYEPFNYLLDHTEQNLRPTLIISSNLNGQEFLNRYEERSLDRIERLCKFVEFKGESLRK